MEKHYEKPEAQVVRYQKRVKTNTEFTDSGGVQHLAARCPYCNKDFFTIRADQYTKFTPKDELIRLYVAFDKASETHFNECPNLPEDFSY